MNPDKNYRTLAKKITRWTEGDPKYGPGGVWYCFGCRRRSPAGWYVPAKDADQHARNCNET